MSLSNVAELSKCFAINYPQPAVVLQAVLWRSQKNRKTHPPVSATNSLVGLDINGVSGGRKWDFMFTSPVTNAGDGFFVVEQISSYDNVIFYPLDANREPISGYSAYAEASSGQWGTGLAPYNISWEWPGLSSLYGNVGGIVIPLYAFTGGSGELAGNVYGLRMYDVNSSIDPMVVGTYHATWGGILGAEFDPPPFALISTDATYNHRYTNAFNLTAITLPNGRYTDIEGPATVISTASYWRTPGTPDPVSGANAMTGLVATAAAINIGTGEKLMFTTPLTSEDDGGFFVVDMSNTDSGDDFTAYPLDITGTRISTWSLSYKAGNFGGLLNTIIGYWSGNDVRDLTGVSFELDTFAGGTPPLTDVYGIELSSSGLDPALVGIYRGPTEAKVTGSARPITDISFTPAPDGNPVSNDFAVTAVSAADITSRYGISGATTVNLHGYYRSAGNIIYPILGTSPGTGYEGRTNSLSGLAVKGVSANDSSGIYAEFMFPDPVIYDTDGFFVIEMGSGREDSITILPLDANRVPISTYSITVGEDSWGRMLIGALVDWANLATHYDLDGVMMTLSDFKGGTGNLAGLVYGIRIEDPSGCLDPLMAGIFNATPAPGTLILIN